MACLLCTIPALVLLGLVIFKIYMKLTTGWCRSQTCLVGKTAIITGANTGIGYETALDFAKRGARVILACRDSQLAETAKNRIIDATGNRNVAVQILDLNSFESVRAFAKKIKDAESRLDILVNNAGMAGVDDLKSKDGHVMVMQINYFSHVLLTHLLIDLLKKTAKSRIVNVSSIAAKMASDYDVNNVDKFAGRFRVYNESKLCNILFTIELAERLRGTDVTTYSLHPGAVKTDIFRHAKGVLKIIFDFTKNSIFKTSEEGAQTTIYCSVAKDIEDYSGEHFADCERVDRYKTVVPGMEKKLWELTLDIVGLKPEEIKI